MERGSFSGCLTSGEVPTSQIDLSREACSASAVSEGLASKAISSPNEALDFGVASLVTRSDKVDFLLDVPDNGLDDESMTLSEGASLSEASSETILSDADDDESGIAAISSVVVEV